MPCMETFLRQNPVYEEKLLPTYKFHQGAPGHSYALDVAKRYGINVDIINEAREFLSNSDINETLMLMDTLQKKMDETVKLEAKLELEKKNINQYLHQEEQQNQVLI